MLPPRQSAAWIWPGRVSVVTSAMLVYCILLPELTFNHFGARGRGETEAIIRQSDILLLVLYPILGGRSVDFFNYDARNMPFRGDFHDHLAHSACERLRYASENYILGLHRGHIGSH